MALFGYVCMTGRSLLNKRKGMTYGVSLYTVDWYTRISKWPDGSPHRPGAKSAMHHNNTKLQNFLLMFLNFIL